MKSLTATLPPIGEFLLTTIPVEVVLGSLVALGLIALLLLPFALKRRTRQRAQALASAAAARGPEADPWWQYVDEFPPPAPVETRAETLAAERDWAN